MATAPYDALAPDHRQYAQRRAAYCDAVDRCIAGWLPARVSSMLDVGSGDGLRAVRLATRLGVDTLVLSDPSAPMREQCRANHAGDVWDCAAESLPLAHRAFDVVTCLWNVLGAIDTPEGHLAALRGMRKCLTPSSRLYLDVHNRYNAAAAGVPRVLARRMRDVLAPGPANGVVSFTWEVEGQRIPSRGYLFAERELRALFAQAGLRPIEQAFVHYDTGARCGPWSGQMVFALEAR